MVAPRTKMTPSEYLAWEREQFEKHEYYRGEVFAMAGGSPRHNHLCSNANGILRERVTGHGCFTFTSDQRVGVDNGERYVYPDVTIVCGHPVMEFNDAITNPTIIVEVLSLGTERNDRGSKWQSYQALATLTDYVLVTQWSPRIEHYLRDRGGWSYRAAGPGDRIVLANGIELGVDEVFARAMELPGDDVSAHIVVTDR